MTKTLQEYYDALYNPGKESLDKSLGQRKATDQQTIADIDTALTKATQNTVDGYQQQIDAAPGEAHASFAKNELQEAIGRQRAELKMANMGMTDSGLSETSQAALSVQRANANADVRRDMQKLVSGLETAINDAWAAKESSLAEKTMAINKATDDWYTAAASQLESDSRTGAATAYKADVERETEIAKLEQEAKEKDLARQHELAVINLKAQNDAAAEEEESKFSPFTFAGADKADPSKNQFYRDGKSYSYAAGINPYTGTTNPDIKHGAFSNGYQPNNVGGQKLSESGKTAGDIFGAGAVNSSGVNIANQNVWYTRIPFQSRRGGPISYVKTYYIWNGSKNQYEEIEYNG